MRVFGRQERYSVFIGESRSAFFNETFCAFFVCSARLNLLLRFSVQRERYCLSWEPSPIQLFQPPFFVMGVSPGLIFIISYRIQLVKRCFVV